MNEPGKVRNPLFSASVTGSTVEDFSQHALLLPAQEKPPVREPTQQQQQKILNQQQDSNLVQSFSDGLNLYGSGSTPLQPQQFSNFATPATTYLDSSNLGCSVSPQTDAATNLPQIPLFSPDSINTSKPQQPPQGPVNSFRGARLKRPVYAQIPGLSTNQPPPPPQSTFQPQPIQQPPFQPKHVQTFQPPSTSPSPLLLEEFTPVDSQFISATSFSSTNMAMPATEVLNQPNIGVPLPSVLPNSQPSNNQIYRPVYHHWFYKQEIETKTIWKPFSMIDSLALEHAFTSNDLDPDKVVATDGGRFDVNILRRQRIPVYWKGSPAEVRRCSWFHKDNHSGRYVPYDENIATKLEEEFKVAFDNNQWHRKVELPSGESVVFHAADVLVLFPRTSSPDAWGNTPNQARPKIVKRGMDEFDIDEGEPTQVDHLLFMVHGIGSVCDLKFRTVEEVVDEFRHSTLQLIQSHYRSSCEKGIVNKIEVLPVSWHEELHGDETGIDKKLKSITLDSIPRLRDFTNDTLLDILFYTSPVYCQTIISTVGNQLNKIFELFKQRNPSFKGGVSLGGHSLGSLILFDLLCHQHPEPELESPIEDEEGVLSLGEAKPPPPPAQRRISRRISYMMGAVGTGQPQIFYPSLTFQPKSFFALGSPIGMFVTVRGLDNLGEQFALPTCPGFFNIFHPYDPVAYRVETLINPELAKLKPVLIPHHKGRKRMHLELKETMARVGADLKQKVIDSVKNTWSSFYQLAMFHKPDQPSIEEEVDKALKQHLKENELEDNDVAIEDQETELSCGILNKGRRMDYVLQEAPLEFFNEYIFALTSHVCYWDSQDTMLLIIKEIYSSMKVQTDSKIPQQTMTIERPPVSPKSARSAAVLGVDPTGPVHENINLGPPPKLGFVRKT